MVVVVVVSHTRSRVLDDICLASDELEKESVNNTNFRRRNKEGTL